MPHYDEETLALLALSESGVTADHQAHLASCPACRNEVDQLKAVVTTGRQATVEDRPVTPPDSVWHRIRTEIRQPAPITAERTDAGESSRSQQAHGPVPEPSLTLLSRTRSRVNPAVLAVAAALIGVLIGVTTLAITRDRPAATSTAAQTVLQPLDAPAAHGTAVLEGRGTRRALTVHVRGLPTVPGTFYEVWLMNAAPRRLLSLGVLDSTHGGVFQIPPGLDVSSYPVVDISLQPFNGSPAHSGNSAVRGTLPA